jgi:hypothetical protein
MNHRALGIYVFSEKKFYYLETGTVYVSNTVDRIRKALVQRDIIKTQTGESYPKQTFEVLTIAQAKEKEYEFVPIYLSKNIEDNKKEESQTKSSW